VRRFKKLGHVAAKQIPLQSAEGVGHEVAGPEVRKPGFHDILLSAPLFFAGRCGEGLNRKAEWSGHSP
jgi:hypothetical protein